MLRQSRDVARVFRHPLSRVLPWPWLCPAGLSSVAARTDVVSRASTDLKIGLRPGADAVSAPDRLGRSGRTGLKNDVTNQREPLFAGNCYRLITFGTRPRLPSHLLGCLEFFIAIGTDEFHLHVASSFLDVQRSLGAPKRGMGRAMPVPTISSEARSSTTSAITRWIQGFRQMREPRRVTEYCT